ncbi:MAG TPA: hypothetical protein VF277_08190 [Steroidobacteraceae bacterium]
MKRRIGAWLACLLVIAQMTIGPVAHPMDDAGSAGPCSHATGTAACGDGDCGHCPLGTNHTAPGPHHGHGGAPSHARCANPCGHTPALATASFLPLRASAPLAWADDPPGSSRDSPLFDFLRPPN